MVEMDTRNSIAWLALSQKVKDELVNACVERENIVPIITPTMMHDTDCKFLCLIHNALGCKDVYNPELIFELESICALKKGGIFDTISQYVHKYRDIEKAAIKEFTEKNKINSIAFS